MEWIVFDYAGVISLPPPEHAGGLLPQTVAAEPERFWPVYWEHRPDYDLGAVSAADFWRTVCGRLGSAIDEDLIDVLAELDARAWAYVNTETVEILQELADAGTPLALLSNAPVELARIVDDQPWAQLFQHRFFSADLGLVKPDPRIFHLVCERLDARPQDLLFVDDRDENTAAAERLGIRSILFTDTAALRDTLKAQESPGRGDRSDWHDVA